MPATVVTSENIAQLATGQAVEAKDLPPMRREVIALKRNPQPKAEDGSVKVDNAVVQDVKDTGPKPKIDIKDIPEDQLPEHVRKIIGKKHREMREAVEFAEFNRLGRVTAEQRVKDLEAQVESLKGGAKPKDEPASRAPATQTGKPKPEDFTNVAEYTDALTDWKLEQREQQRAQKQTDDAKTERSQKLATVWQERVAEVMESNPDFESVVTEAFADYGKKMASTVLDEIEESPLGPRMLLHLATHKDEMATFRTLNAEKQIKYLGKLEAKLEAPQAKEEPKPQPKADPPKNVSQAPPPMSTDGVVAAVVRKDPRDMTTEEYIAHKRAERSARRR